MRLSDLATPQYIWWKRWDSNPRVRLHGGFRGRSLCPLGHSPVLVSLSKMDFANIGKISPLFCQYWQRGKMPLNPRHQRLWWLFFPALPLLFLHRMHSIPSPLHQNHSAPLTARPCFDLLRPRVCFSCVRFVFPVRSMFVRSIHSSCMHSTELFDILTHAIRAPSRAPHAPFFCLCKIAMGCEKIFCGGYTTLPPRGCCGACRLAIMPPPAVDDTERQRRAHLPQPTTPYCTERTNRTPAPSLQNARQNYG